MFHHINHDVITLIAAVVLGGVIGLEREVSNKAAGLRTNILICLGATLFTLVSVKVFDVRDAHIPAQIIAGMGFLGAGAIMREGEHVTGLTTAATIWTVAALGMTLGFHYYFLAAAVTVIVLFVQLAFTPIDALINDWQERHTFRIVSTCDEQDYAEISGIFEKSGLEILRRKLMKKQNQFYSEWYCAGGRPKQEAVMRKLLGQKGIIEVTY
jgi:putative Mg2+ transporter-C (MgtC) family protein